MYKAALLSSPHWYAAELIGAPKHAQANLPTRARSADAAPSVPAQRARANSGEKCGLARCQALDQMIGKFPMLVQAAGRCFELGRFGGRSFLRQGQQQNCLALGR